MHGGTCMNGTCVCPTGFIGEACQESGMYQTVTISVKPLKQQYNTDHPISQTMNNCQ